MSQTYATMTLGGTDRNVEFLGDYVAWLISNALISGEIDKTAVSEITRVRMQDMTGPEFLSVVLFGELTSGHLTDEGQAFTEHYLLSGRYEDDYSEMATESDDWVRYRNIAPLITRRWQAFTRPDTPARTAKILKFPG